MKNSIFIFIFLFIPVFIFAQKGPVFEIDGGETIKLGNQIRGKEVVHEIQFKNSGDEGLKINSVVTTCGCSSALLSKDSLLPGETGSIKFTFNGSGFGEVQKNVNVSTNEKEYNNHTIVMVINLVDPLTVDPASVLADGKKGDEISKIITLSNTLSREIQITEIASNSPAVVITSDKDVINSGESATFKIAITIYEDSPVNAAVTIKTSEGEYNVPIFVDVKSDTDVKTDVKNEN
ncbi:MAG: DUF1573 domain-containing protein [Ignavibacteriae bacterium]|nr:MAG: DUF1573 domain-containing protein [Ignavibacteriota bacterium]